MDKHDYPFFSILAEVFSKDNNLEKVHQGYIKIPSFQLSDNYPFLSFFLWSPLLFLSWTSLPGQTCCLMSTYISTIRSLSTQKIIFFLTSTEMGMKYPLNPKLIWEGIMLIFFSFLNKPDINLGLGRSDMPINHKLTQKL